MRSSTNFVVERQNFFKLNYIDFSTVKHVMPIIFASSTSLQSCKENFRAILKPVNSIINSLFLYPNFVVSYAIMDQVMPLVIFNIAWIAKY